MTATPSSRLLAALILAPALAGAVHGAETMRTIDWNREGGDLVAGVTRGARGNGSATIRIDGAALRDATVPLWSLDEPGVGHPSYALVGEIRYTGVGEPGYLEMWSHFDNGGFYFSRTLAVAGPMRSLQGDSPWRRFVLPFHLWDAPKGPIRLELNLVLPAGGEVEIGPVSLLQYAQGESVAATAQPGRTTVPAAAALAGSLLIAGLALRARRRRLTTRSELRRIEALDAGAAR